MYHAGFEPAHPEIVGLKSTALDHSANDTYIPHMIIKIYNQIFSRYLKKSVSSVVFTNTVITPATISDIS
jgi:hypothetical protein